MKTGRKFSSLVVVLALLAACGGESADDTTTTQPQATTTAPEATTTEAGNGNGMPSAECLQASEAMAEAMENYGQAFTGGTSDFGMVAAQLDALAEAAPEVIRDDFRIMAEELGDFYRAMEEFDFTPGATPTPEQLAALQAAMESVDEEALTAATENIESWVQENCN